MEKTIELLDGTEVKLKEVWNCCDGTRECGSSIEVYDAKTNILLTTLEGKSLPDTDDEDYNEDYFVEEIEMALDGYFFGIE
jgi:hypothetical protein